MQDGNNTVDPVEVLKLGEREVLREIENLEARLSAIRQAIILLEGQGMRGDLPHILPNDFAGMKLVDAVIKYLRIRAKTGKEPSAKVREEVVPQLVKGGLEIARSADLGQKYRILMTSISRNISKGLIQYDSGSDTVTLTR
jgi:hypothetical protein